MNIEKDIFKLGTLIDNVEKKHTYKNAWSYCENNSIHISIRSNPIDFVLDISEENQESFWVLYVLLVSRNEELENARYQIPTPIPFGELKLLLDKYRDFLTYDGRHHLWVASSKTNFKIIYDQHDVFSFTEIKIRIYRFCRIRILINPRYDGRRHTLIIIIMFLTLT